MKLFIALVASFVLLINSSSVGIAAVSCCSVAVPSFVASFVDSLFAGGVAALLSVSFPHAAKLIDNNAPIINVVHFFKLISSQINIILIYYPVFPVINHEKIFG
ncbi:hypothetical protein D3C73_1328610 [compost metagenome]